MSDNNDDNDDNNKIDPKKFTVVSASFSADIEILAVFEYGVVDKTDLKAYLDDEMQNLTSADVVYRAIENAKELDVYIPPDWGDNDHVYGADVTVSDVRRILETPVADRRQLSLFSGEGAPVAGDGDES